jgi:hypothetical protein
MKDESGRSVMRALHAGDGDGGGVAAGLLGSGVQVGEAERVPPRRTLTRALARERAPVEREYPLRGVAAVRDRSVYLRHAARCSIEPAANSSPRSQRSSPGTPPNGPRA